MQRTKNFVGRRLGLLAAIAALVTVEWRRATASHREAPLRSGEFSGAGGLQVMERQDSPMTRIPGDTPPLIQTVPRMKNWRNDLN